MGIIKAVVNAIGGGLADSWLEVYESDSMNDATVFTTGVKVRKGDTRSSNTKGTEGTISNGSIIHVYDNQCMLLVDGGKVVDYTAEPGYYKVDHSSMPSLFNGELGASVKETFSRVKYGGVPSGKQQVFFINLQEIKGIKFGTRNPLQYYDNFYNSELFLARARQLFHQDHRSAQVLHGGRPARREARRHQGHQRAIPQRVPRGAAGGDQPAFRGRRAHQLPALQGPRAFQVHVHHAR